MFVEVYRVMKFLHLLQLSSKWALLLAIAGSLAGVHARASSQPPEPGANVVIATAEDPNTHEKKQLVLKRSAPEEIEAYSPKNLKNPARLKALLQRVRQAAATRGATAGETILDVHGELGLFTASVGLMEVQRLLLDYDSKPDALKQFWLHQIKNPFSWLSFYTFVAANRGGSAVYQALALKMNWIRDEKVFAEFMDTLAKAHFNKDIAQLSAEGESAAVLEILNKAEAQLPKPRFDNFFKTMKAPTGLAVGIFLSGLTFDLIGDPNIHRCATDWSDRQDQLVDYCEEAYQEWLVRGRIVDYAPQMAGAALTSLIQTYLLSVAAPKLAVAGRALLPKNLPVVEKIVEFKGVQLTLKKLSQLSRLKPVRFIGSTLIFLELSPYITAPFERKYYEQKLGGEIAELENQLRSPQQLPPVTVAALIEKYSQANVRWRDHWQQPIQAKLQAWIDYVSNLQIDYFSAQTFYRELVKRLAMPTLGEPLFQSNPYNGLDPQSSPEVIGQKIVRAVKLANARIAQLSALGPKANEKQLLAIALLKSAVSSLMSIDEESPINASLAKAFQQIQNNKSLDAYAISQQRLEARQQEFVNGIHLIQKLADDPSLSTYGFADMNIILKGASPQGPGEFAIARMSNNAEYIRSFSRAGFPDKIGQVQIHNKGEYFLALATCGKDSHLLQEFWGIGLAFEPPKLINDGGFRFCDQRPMNLTQGSSNWSPFTSVWRDRTGTTFTGLVNVLANYLRPDFKGPEGLGHFETFWQNSVASVAQRKMADKDAEFSKMMATSVRPLLASEETYESQGRKIPLGTYRSLESEASVYVSVLESMATAKGLRVDFGPLKTTLKTQLQLLEKNLDPDQVIGQLMPAEKVTLSNKLSVPLAALRASDVKSIRAAKIRGLSEVLEDRLQTTLGPVLEKTKGNPEIFTIAILVKMKLTGLRLQLQNLLALDEALKVQGL